MDSQTLIFLFMLTVFAVLCLNELLQWLEEGKVETSGYRSEKGPTACVGPHSGSSQSS
jgi:hypothetical protein